MKKAPDITLLNAEGQPCSLDQWRGQWVVVYFYPKDDTPGCTVEAQEFTALLPQFAQQNIHVIGISPDSSDSHCQFARKYDLEHTLLADEEKRAAKAFGAWGMKKNYGKEYEGLMRSTFLINPEGEVVREWKNVRAKGHAAKVLAATQS